jgi:excisionase family DNA binding protein
VEADSAAEADSVSRGWLSLREAALRLGVSERTIRRRIHSGTLRAERAVGAFGPEYRLTPEVVESAQVRQTVTVLPQPPAGDARQLAALIAAAVEPLVTELAALRADLAAERAEAAQERVELHRLLAEQMRQLPDAAPAQDAATRAEEPATLPAPVEPSQTTPAPARGFWARLFGR